jgi:hypothetical protein
MACSAAAQQVSPADRLWLPGNPLAESGKPAPEANPSWASPGPSQSCVAPLPCGARVIGTVRKNGAVELQVPAYRW